MTDTTTTLDFGPMIQFVAPIAATIASAAITAGIAAGVALLQKWTGLKVSEAQVAAVRTFAQDQAAKAIAMSESNLARQSVTITSPQVIAGVQLAQKVIPELLKATNTTPEHVAGMITAEIGKLQAAPPAVVTAIDIAPVSGTTADAAVLAAFKAAAK